ncbi:MAG: sulfite exporter TauE/SafE family protein [Desulfatibacillum sp.]|nr:sulfite exporter TauE/SafE family protein [Desulfatibacillum sp.]
MMELIDSSLLILGGIVLLSYTVQTLSGFGSTIIAVTLGSHLYPISFLLPVLVPLDLFLNTYLMVRHRRHIKKPVLFRQILPAMGLGLLVGMALFSVLEGDILKKVLGIFVVLLSSRELWIRLRRKGGPKPISTLRFNGFTAAAGVVHGIYASGGPLLIYALSRLNLSKASFRSTLAALWTILNLVLTVYYVASGKATSTSFSYIMLLFPLILAGIVIGEKLHTLIDEYTFTILVFVLLLGAGISIII